MLRLSYGICQAWAVLPLMLAAVSVFAAEPEIEPLPTNPAMWLNSPPLSAESLQGKGVLLWFFEETCPSCRGKWPGMYQLAAKYQGKPIVFIAVNSGTSPAEIQKYAREVKLTWPIIVDPTREFEKQWLGTPISLQNIHQCELILPTGEQTHGSWKELDASAERALEGASWKIDPTTIPAAFLPTWQQVELGNYAAAANLLKKGLLTKNAEVKQAATRVHDFVQTQIRNLAEEAASARAGGDAWRAYQLYNQMATTFAGYDLPPEAAGAQKELAMDATVKKQLEATKSLEAIKKAMATAKTEAARKRLASRLEQLGTQFPQTDAASEAARLLQQITGR